MNEKTDHHRTNQPQPRGYYKDVPPIDPWIIQKLWDAWESDRPELLFSARPRRTSHAAG
jgi:hypothetical protein